jgi:hypothetical protein
MKKKDYNLLALAVTCSWCGARKGEPCRRSPRKKPDDHIKARRVKRASARRRVGRVEVA